LQRLFGLDKERGTDGEKNDTDQPVACPQGKGRVLMEYVDKHDEQKQTSDDCQPYSRSDCKGSLAYLVDLQEKLIPQELELLAKQRPQISK